MIAPLRLVLDTNVVLSALLWHGRPAELLDLGATDQVRLFTSEALVAELERSLAKPRLAARIAATGLFRASATMSKSSLARSRPAQTQLSPEMTTCWCWVLGRTSLF